MRSLLNAYMNYRTFGLFFHPHLWQILLNTSSIWSCENLYARKYCNGQHSWDRYSCESISEVIQNFLWGKALKDIPEPGLAQFVQPIAMQELTILTLLKDVQIIRRSKTMNPNHNFEKPFDCLKIELETNFFSFHVKVYLVSGTELKFTLSAVVLKIQHVEVDVIKSQEICSFNSSCIDNKYSLKSSSICCDKCIHIFHLRK